LLSDVDIRRKLNSEATPVRSQRADESLLCVPAARSQALAQLWRVIIRNALVATQKISSASRKRQQEACQAHVGGYPVAVPIAAGQQ
jgi:hypothetical protein